MKTKATAQNLFGQWKWIGVHIFLTCLMVLILVTLAVENTPQANVIDSWDRQLSFLTPILPRPSRKANYFAAQREVRVFIIGGCHYI